MERTGVMMNIQRFVSNGDMPAVQSSEQTKALTRMDIIKRQEISAGAYWRSFVLLLFALPYRLMDSFGGFLRASRLLNQKNLARRNIRLLEDSANGGERETALAVVRPALLELAIESVPAIDLGSQQQLAWSLFEVMDKTDRRIVDSLWERQLVSQVAETREVTIISTSRALDAQTIAQLFRVEAA